MYISLISNKNITEYLIKTTKFNKLTEIKTKIFNKPEKLCKLEESSQTKQFKSK